jgi:hypothetical protein
MRRSLSCVFAVVVWFAIVPVHAQPTPATPAKRNPSVGKARIPSRELQCRGGAGIQLTGNPVMEDNGYSKTMEVQLSFVKSSKVPHLRGGGLDAGTCSWTDRLIRDDEPSSIRFKTGNSVVPAFYGEGEIELPCPWCSATLFQLTGSLAKDTSYWSFMGIRSGQSFKVFDYDVTKSPTLHRQPFETNPNTNRPHIPH